MRSELQRQTARLNGAKSRGPITAAGKRRCSQNARRHGLYSRHILRSTLTHAPDPHEQQDLHPAYLDYIHAIALETRFLADEIARQRTLHTGESDSCILALAYAHLCDTGVIEALYRLYCAASRNWESALERLASSERANTSRPSTPRAQNTFCETNPASIRCETDPAHLDSLRPHPRARRPGVTPSHPIRALYPRSLTAIFHGCLLAFVRGQFPAGLPGAAGCWYLSGLRLRPPPLNR